MNDEFVVESMEDNDVNKLHDHIMNELGYVSTPTGFIKANKTPILNTNYASNNSQSVNLVNYGIETLGNFVSDTINSNPYTEKLPTTIKDAVAGLVTMTLVNLVKSGGDKFLKVDTYDDGGEGDDSGRYRDPSGSSKRLGSPHYHLDYGAEPIEVRLDTGIVPDTYSPMYHTAENSYSSPLHLNTAIVTLPEYNNGSDLDKYFQKVIDFVFTNAVQSAVSFSIGVTTLSASNLYSAFSYLLEALQIYYFYDSILAYSSNPLNKNDGMLALRTAMTAEDINDYMNLRSILSGTPIPPNMFDLCFYMCQNYQTSHLPGSSIIKMCPVLWNATTNRPDSSKIELAISNIGTYQAAFSLISRACPNWVKGTMPGSSINPLHDPNFNTIWANMPYCLRKRTAGSWTWEWSGPSADANGEIKYNSFTNELDGAAYALTALYSGNSKWAPSLITPIIGNYAYTDANNYTNSTRLSWIYPGVFGDAYQNRELSLQRADTYAACQQWTDPDIQTVQRFGTEICKAVTLSTVTNSAQKLMDWMFSFNSFGRLPDERIYHKNKSKSNKPKKKKRAN